MPPHPSGSQRVFSRLRPQQSETARRQAASPFQAERRPRGTSSCKATPRSQALPPPTSPSLRLLQATSSRQRPAAPSSPPSRAPTTPLPVRSRRHTPSRRRPTLGRRPALLQRRSSFAAPPSRSLRHQHQSSPTPPPLSSPLVRTSSPISPPVSPSPQPASSRSMMSLQ